MVNNSLDQRLTLLETSGVISNSTKKNLLSVIKFFATKYKIYLSEDLGSTMITHLAMALTRINNNEALAKQEDSTIYDEIVRGQYFAKSQSICNELEKILGLTLPDSERVYMLVHIYTILDSLQIGVD